MRALLWNGRELKNDSSRPRPASDDRRALVRVRLAGVRPRGTLVLKSTHAEAHRLSLAPLVINEITVVGSRCGPFAPALAALAQKEIAVLPMIDRIYGLEEGPAALRRAAQSGTLKVLLSMAS